MRMTDQQKIPWFRICNEKTLLNKIERDRTLLNESNIELIRSTRESQFIIEPECLMAGLAFNRDILEADYDYEKFFEEVINPDMICNNY
jgi:hypothetical protein